MSAPRRVAVFIGASLLAACAVACGSSSGGTGKTGGSTDGGSHDAETAPTECSGRPLPPGANAGTAAPAPGSLAPYFPTSDFRTADPAEAGFDPVKLDAALSLAPAHTSTQGIVVVRYGYLVAERYAAGFSADTRHESYSMAKSFSSALVGIAIDQGLLPGVHEPICGYYPEWGCDAADARSRITVEHVMNVESGLAWSEDWRVGATAPNDVFLAGANLLDYVLSRPIADEPGTKQRYSTGDPSLLTAVLQSVTGKTAFDYAKEVLLGPIGLSGVGWASDSKGRTTTYAGVSATAREFAKFGLLYLRGGNWDGRQIVPQSWVDFTTRAKDPCHDQYRYLWHVNPPFRLGQEDPACPGFLQCDPVAFANLPANAFFAEGIFGQFIFVVPSADLVIARVAQDDLGGEYWDDYAKALLEAVLGAMVR